jgi:heme exporter protein CcmD
MFFDSLQDAWTMGGHGAYVWSSVGICVLSWLWLAAREILSQRQCIRREQRRQQAMAVDRVVEE